MLLAFSWITITYKGAKIMTPNQEAFAGYILAIAIATFYAVMLVVELSK
jgi:hypothetical protein